MRKDFINLIISWTIVLVFFLTVPINYKEDYQDVSIFLSFFVVLIPLIFSTTWIKGVISAIISFLGILFITFLFWYIKNLYSDFAFENYIPYSGMVLNSIKGVITGVLLKSIYLISKKISNCKPETDYTIRRAEIKDAEGIATVHVRTWQTHYSEQVPTDYLNKLSIEQRTKKWSESLSNQKPTTITLVAESKGIVFGFCSMGPSRDTNISEDISELYVMYVDQTRQGKGIGTDLMKKGLNFLKEEGFKLATLWVLKTNIKTINFYESKGWKSDNIERKEDVDNFVFDEIRYSINLI